MDKARFHNAVADIIDRDPRYAQDAYEFINDAVRFTVVKLNRHRRKGEARHLSAEELLRGVAEYAKESFGPLAGSVLAEWGVRDGPSIGNVVFNMIDERILSKSDNDSLEDFNVKFDFQKLFDAPIQAEASQKAPPLID